MVLLPLSERSIRKDQAGEFVDLGRFLSESVDTLNFEKKEEEKGTLNVLFVVAPPLQTSWLDDKLL